MNASDHSLNEEPQRAAAAHTRLTLLPIGLDEANAFVAQHHRHHKPVVGHKFSLGASLGNSIVGVAIVGRPVARFRDDGLTLEVTRLCTDGARNACSFLYGAAARACFALGYKRIGTYSLASEDGASLRAANWRQIGEVKGRSWSCQSRPRVDTHPTTNKLLFEMSEPQSAGPSCQGITAQTDSAVHEQGSLSVVAQHIGDGEEHCPRNRITETLAPPNAESGD